LGLDLTLAPYWQFRAVHAGEILPPAWLLGAVDKLQITPALRRGLCAVLVRSSTRCGTHLPQTTPAERQAKDGRAAILQPEWLAKLQAEGGYELDQNEFSASFGKDERLRPGLRITVEVTSPE
jgi:hypothetical protein